MEENQDIHDAILSIMKSMRLQGTSPSRLKNYRKRIQCVRTLFVG
jgi:hypothetical protein